MADPTLAEALQEMSERIGVSLEKIAGSVGGIKGEPLAGQPKVESTPNEKVFIRYTLGKGGQRINGRQGGVSFSTVEGKRYGLVNKNMFKPDGTFDGTNQMVLLPFAPGYGPPIPAANTPQVIYRRPPLSTGPWEVGNPIQAVAARSSLKSVWNFNDIRKSKIYAAGLAQVLLVPLAEQGKCNGNQLFLLSVSAIITGGSGKYEGATGVTSTNSSSFLSKGADLFTIEDGKCFEGLSAEIFRVVLAKNWDKDEAELLGAKKSRRRGRSGSKPPPRK